MLLGKNVAFPRLRRPLYDSGLEAGADVKAPDCSSHDSGTSSGLRPIFDLA